MKNYPTSGGGRLDRVVEELEGAPDGLNLDDLCDRLRSIYPHLRHNQLKALLETDSRFDLDGDRVRIRPECCTVDDQHLEGNNVRVVAFDFESVVRLADEQRFAFQLGAVRFGSDRRWVHAQRSFNEFLELPEEAEELLEKESVRQRYLERRRPRAEIISEFIAFITDADVIVAYNGTGLDFGLLDDECARSELPQPAQTRVDGLYLAHALWPVPPRQHRLHQLLERLRLDTGDFVFHDALDDSRALALLLSHGARLVAGWDAGLVDLVASAGRRSEAWGFLFRLMGGGPAPTQHPEDEVADVLRTALDPKIRLRPAEADAVPVAEVVIPLSVQSASAPSQVDVNRLASAARGEEAEPRPSQVAMVETMRQFLSAGQDALIEAPTGTGKSYAVMAVALEWLAADPRHRVAISTYTKQLQRQLAQDIERLSKAGLPGIAEATDMVKGAGNRLSLRALVAALAACTSDAAPPRRRRGGGFAREPRFADLLLYLTLRLRAQGGLLEEWEAHSVDGFDVPGFFSDYCGSRLSTYLWSLSQGSSGEMGASHSGGLGRHTRTVREALERSRFAIANHALLLANLEAFDDIGEHTLLVVDEAHVLEGTATASLTANIDYQSLEDAIAAVRRWHTDQGEGAVPVDLTQALDDVENFLRLEQLPRSARAALDTLPRDPLHRDFPRQMTLIAPTSSENPSPAINALFSSIEEMRHHLDQLQRSFRLVPTPGDPFELERLQLLRFGIAELGAALSLIARSIASNLAPPGADAPAEPPASGNGAAPAADAETEDEGQDEAEEPTLPEEERETPTAALARQEPAARPNQVVWLQELSGTQQTIELRQYTFRINSSPVDLAEEPRYRRFLRSFGRSFFVSATLRVAEKWDFIRRRLGLDSSTVAARHLESPFNAATQARLICFDDFPSWMEQEEAATRTVAHQVAGYLSAVGQDGANGAIVLTTARATAAAISDHLVEMRRRSGGTYHISSTIMLGNERAVDTFRDLGGALVGTKGLWQGVDINDPQRLRLVWINKLPFPSFADPVIAARIATIHREAEADGAASPQDVANETYYLPLAAIELRQAVGRLIRTLDHRGVVVISDRKLAGTTRLRRLYRSIFLGSLDSGLLLPDPETGEIGGGNVTGMAEGWRRIWEFLVANGIVSTGQFADLTQAEAIDRLIHLPQLRLIREAMMTSEAEAEAREEGRLEAELLERGTTVLRALKFSDDVKLKDKQEEALQHIAAGRDLLAVLPTGYGKSYVFQLPALALSGVTVVVSPLVALMTDQALELNKTIGGAVRALVAPMRESNSRTGKVEVYEQLTQPGCQHGIKLVYLSPERLCQRHFQDQIREGVRLGLIRRIVIDEAHTLVQWGDDFRPSFRRAELFLQELRAAQPKLQLIALTATATRSVLNSLRARLFQVEPGQPDPANLGFVQANPIRPELALYRRQLTGGDQTIAGLLEAVVGTLREHAIVYCLTVKEVEHHYHHLSAVLDDPSRLRKFHGRMSESEKLAVANDFRRMGRHGQDGFVPMIVIATSAFGLGVDRDDVRTVFVLSPPTDLAALYQQLGRAGRDGKPSVGLALSHGRGYRTIAFMTRSRPEDATLPARAAALLMGGAELLNLREIAEALAVEDARHGQTPDEATVDHYQTLVVRVLAHLDAAGLIEDLGDLPETLAILPGSIEPDVPELARIVTAILKTIEDGDPGRVHLETLRGSLASQPELLALYPDELADCGAAWSLLMDLHALGHLDVSQQPNRAYLTGLRVTGDPAHLPSVLQDFDRRQQRVDDEFQRLREFFEEECCVNESFREYFGAAKLPPDTCVPPECRCSWCWNQPGHNEPLPPLLTAFETHAPTPASASPDFRQAQAKLLEQRILSLLLSRRGSGLAESLIGPTLRGEDFYTNKTKGRTPLWGVLRNSSIFGSFPGLRREVLHQALVQLETRGQVARDGAFWKHARFAGSNRASATAASASAGRD